MYIRPLLWTLLFISLQEGEHFNFVLLLTVHVSHVSCGCLSRALFHMVHMVCSSVPSGGRGQLWWWNVWRSAACGLLDHREHQRRTCHLLKGKKKNPKTKPTTKKHHVRGLKRLPDEAISKPAKLYSLKSYIISHKTRFRHNLVLTLKPKWQMYCSLN